MRLPYFTGDGVPLILAPMAGVSEAPFRQICRRFGADVLMTEFLSAEAIRRGIRKTLEGAEFEEIERPIGVQIYGADADAMARAAAIVTEAYRPEFIDINFGCPGKKGGQRSGWNEETRDPVAIALRMQDAGARAFTLHARTRTQMFTGHADWDEIAMVVEALSIPVIGNGDVTGPEDILRLQRHTGCAAIMVGRGSFGNPGIFRDGVALLRRDPLPPAPPPSERFRVALEHAGMALRLQGDSRRTVIEFRKHLGWYTKGLPGASQLREQLFKVETMVEAEALFRDYLEEHVTADMPAA